MKILFYNLFFLILFSSNCVAQTQEYSIREFVAIEDDWDSLIGKPLRLEGRYSSLAPTKLRFQHCSLSFTLPSNPRRLNGQSKTLQVNGTLKKDKNKLVFQVNSFRIQPDDIEAVLRKSRLLPKSNPAGWYLLGKKTVERGKFYKDNLLQQRGVKLLSEAIEIEKKQQKNLTPEILLSLAAKASNVGLPDRSRLSLVFESCLLGYRTGKKSRKFDFSKLRKLVEEKLPGSIIPLTSLKGVTFDQFRKAPLPTYQEANDHARRQLSRLFFLQVLQEEFNRQLNKNASNGDAIATSYEKIAPDDPETAAMFRNQALLFRSNNITQAHRNEVLEVAKQYRKQDNEELAQVALKKWLDHRASQLNKAGPSDFVATANDYEQWFSNKKKADEILLAGIEKFPSDEAILAQLAQRGFVKREGKWVILSELPQTMPNQIEKAIQSGRIVKGMTREQVAKSLGAPKTVSRIASARQTVLVWNYPDSHLAIRFTQRPNKQGYFVVEVNTLAGK